MNDTSLVAALTGLFVVTLWPVYVLEDVFVWVLWGVAMVGLSGWALVTLNLNPD